MAGRRWLKRLLKPDPGGGGDEVHILSKVTIKNLKTNKQFDYTLVSPEEADFQAGKISVTSPVGKGLTGTKVGDIVKVKVPAGLLELNILKLGL